MRASCLAPPRAGPEASAPALSRWREEKSLPDFREARGVSEEERGVDPGPAADAARAAGIRVETGMLPKTHGSALFTRGETQAIVVATLGTMRDAALIDALEGTYKDNFMLHYNFPPYSVGEARPLRGGHQLAERFLIQGNGFAQLCNALRELFRILRGIVPGPGELAGQLL